MPQGNENQTTRLRASRIKQDERVVFFPTVAHQEKGGEAWSVPVHGWIFEPEKSRIRRGIIEEALERKYGLDPDEGEAPARLARTLNPFLVDNQRAKTIAIRMAGRTYLLPPSGPNGHFSGSFSLPAAQVEDALAHGAITYSAVLAAGDSRSFEGNVLLHAPKGISVISDIDDTIKLSYVTDHAKMFEATFYKPYQAVPGMAEVYKAWEKQGAGFHFVSSSPWQLFEELHAFASGEGFPRASFSLKYVRFTDRTFWNLFKEGSETKPVQIRAILQRFPQRRFVLVGDSGEQDPEVYAALARAHPDQVVLVCIRNVAEAAPDDERFASLFSGIEASRWLLFKEPAELEHLLPD